MLHVQQNVKLGSVSLGYLQGLYRDAARPTERKILYYSWNFYRLLAGIQPTALLQILTEMLFGIIFMLELKESEFMFRKTHTTFLMLAVGRKFLVHP
jgi:hypothetical protein